MSNENNCKIVKDLLPNYLDNLTSKETNDFIENHLKTCKKCQEDFDGMKKEFEKINNNQVKEIKYAKKYNRKLRLLGMILGIIILMLIVAFLRNAIIISSLCSKAENYENSNNYHLTWTSHDKESASVFDTLYKDGVYVTKIYSYIYDKKNVENGGGLIATFYGKENEGETAYYSYDKSIKTSDEITNMLKPQNFASITEANQSVGSFLWYCISNTITTAICNGKECYRFSNTNIYVDKQTGLTLRTEETYYYQDVTVDTISDITIEFNEVEDEDITPPSFEDYTIIQ